MSLKLVWPIVVLVLAAIGYVLFAGSSDDAPVEESESRQESSPLVRSTDPASVPAGVATDGRPAEWSAPERTSQQLTQPVAVSQGVTDNSRPQSGPIAVGPGSSTPAGQGAVGSVESVTLGTNEPVSSMQAPEMSRTGAPRIAPESTEYGATADLGVAPDVDEIDVENSAPEAGVLQIEGLPPEASDPGTIGPAPEDSK